MASANTRDIVLSILGKDLTGPAIDSVVKNFDKLAAKVNNTQTGFEKFEAGLGSLAVPALAAGAAVAGFGAISVNAFAGFERSINQAAVASEATAAEVESLSALAKQLGADTVFGAGEAAGALLELAKGGLEPAQIQAGALKNTMHLAAAGGLELADAAVTVVGAMGAFGIAADNTAQVANALAGAANSSSTNVYELSQGLAQVGAQANLSHLSLQETVGVLGAFADAGVRGSDAGTSLKTMLQRLVPQTKEASTEMKNLGIKFTNADGSFKSISEVADILQDKMGKLTDAQKANALQTIFGSDATRAAAVLMNQGSEGIQKYITAANDQTAAQKMADAAMQGVGGSIEKMKGSLETLQVSFGEALAPAVTKASDALSGAFGWMTENKGLVLNLATGVSIFAGIILAASAALKVHNTITAVNTMLTGNLTLAETRHSIATGITAAATKVWSAAQWLLNTSFYGFPLVWVIVGIAALVAAIVWVATKTTWFQTIWEHVWGFLKGVGAWFAGPFAGFFVAAFGAIVAGAQFVGGIFVWLWENAIKPAVDFIVAYFKVWAAIASWLWDNILSPIFGLIGAIFRLLWEVFIQPIVDYIVAYFQFWGSVVLWLWEKSVKPTIDLIAWIFVWLWEKSIKPTIDLIVAGVVWLGNAVVWLWDKAIKPAGEFIGGIFVWLWEEAIKPAVDAIVAGVVWLGDGIMWLWDHAVKPAVDFIVAYVLNLVATWKLGVERITAFINTFTDNVKKAREWVGEQVGKVIDYFKEMPGKIGSFLSGLKDTIVSAFIGGFNWINDQLNKVIRGANTAIGWMNKIPGVNLSLIPEIPKFHSGGTFRAPTGMSEGLALLKDGEKILTPDQAADSDTGGGGVVMYGDIHITVDPTKFRTIEEFLVWLDNLRNSQRRKAVAA